jgi:hypothetical protein
MKSWFIRQNEGIKMNSTFGISLWPNHLPLELLGPCQIFFDGSSRDYFQCPFLKGFCSTIGSPSIRVS